MNKIIITKEELLKAGRLLQTKGYTVVALNNVNSFEKITAQNDFVIEGSASPTAISLKEYFFPKSEPLFFYNKKKEDVEITDPPAVNEKIIVIGAKPCDAAALPIISKVFNWDYKDDFFNSRYDNSVIITVACSYHDEYCFCESVGLSPESMKGSDLFLTPETKDTFHVTVVTEKGKAILEEINHPALEDAPSSMKETPQNSSQLSNSFNNAEVKTWLDSNFEHQYWNSAGEMCLGCAQCAFVCPVCHCFDIVDEQHGTCAGRRAKNWDACQFSLFTRHASGHNPRNNQEKRYRQRINHKFKYYPEKFEEILCTGCGRCSRGCPVSIDILQILNDINVLQNPVSGN